MQQNAEEMIDQDIVNEPVDQPNQNLPVPQEQPQPIEADQALAEEE